MGIHFLNVKPVSHCQIIMKYLFLAVFLVSALSASSGQEVQQEEPAKTIVYPNPKSPITKSEKLNNAQRKWRSMNEETTAFVEDAASKAVAVKSQTEVEAETFFTSLQNAVLTQYSNLKVPSWEQLSEGARNTISVITKNVGLGVPYGIVFALFGAILYATFVVVSTGITMKMNLLDLGTEFLRTNMPIFTGGEIEGGDLLSSRMMTETLLPMVYQAFDKFGAVDTAEEETNE